MRRLVLALGGLGLVLGGCSSTGGHAPAAAPARTAPAQAVSGQTVPGQTGPGQTASGQGAGEGSVSGAARMICGDEAGGEIEQALGVSPTQRPTPAVQPQVYSCRYVYDGATMVLSVREYADKTATDAGFAGDRAAVAPAVDLPAIGDAAIAGVDGSVFARKDAKILHVDVSGVPARFGIPPRPRAGIAQIVAVVIMNCWRQG